MSSGSLTNLAGPQLPYEEIVAVRDAIGGEGPWTVEPVPYEPGSPATGALLRLRGRNWSVFVKQIHAVRHWPRLSMVPEPIRAQFVADFPWRQELQMWDEPFAGRLPKGLRVPLLYRLTDLGDDRLLIWMEDVDAASEADWTPDTFTRAAGVLGGLAALRSAPDVLASSTSPPNFGLRQYVEGNVQLRTVPVLQDDAVWRHPWLAGSADLRAGLLRIAASAPSILDRLASLPMAMPHGDASPQNLLVPRAEPEMFVAIDISFQGPLPIGFDLGQLLIGLAHAGHLDLARLPEIHAQLVPAFVEGMAREGYVADADEVAYAYIGCLVLRAGFTSLPFHLLRGDEDAPDRRELFRQRLALTRFLADLGLAII
jgi:hypothetical protein